MYTSAKKSWENLSLIYLGITLFTALFGAVYEVFSHEVYSYYMIYAFAFPLILGVLPCLNCLILDVQRVNRTAIHFWNSGVITLTVGSLFFGILEIYGTTNKLAFIYPIAGVLFLLAGMILWLISRRK